MLQMHLQKNRIQRTAREKHNVQHAWHVGSVLHVVIEVSRDLELMEPLPYHYVTLVRLFGVM